MINWLKRAAFGLVLAFAPLAAFAQTASLLPNGEQQFIDQNGAPYAGGQVYFYIPHTTTFKNTWQDPYQVTLNTNPVTLDSSGRAIIYGYGQYRQILRDQYGNTIWDQLTTDEISLITTIGVSNIIAAIPSQSISSSALINTGVLPGTYTNTNLTVNSAGQLTAASNGSTGPFPIAGLARSVAMSQSSALSTATFTATQLTVSNGLSNGAATTVLNAYSGTVNVSLTGPGGCDVINCSPALGFLDIYAVYNPTLGQSSIQACWDGTCAGAQVYPSSSISVGATQSALLAVLPTDAVKDIKPGAWFGRQWWYEKCPGVFPGTQTGTAALTASSTLSVTAPEAIQINGFMSIASNTAGLDWGVAADTAGTGEQTGTGSTAGVSAVRACSGALDTVASWSFNVPMVTPGILAWSEGGTHAGIQMSIVGYQIP